MAEKTQKRRRPSAKETRARMARAVGTESPISRAEEAAEPEVEETIAEESDAGPTGRGGAAATTAARRRSGGKLDDAGRLVRLSVDVSAGEHRSLRVMAAMGDTTGMAVMRALLQEALEDDNLAERVLERVAGE